MFLCLLHPRLLYWWEVQCFIRSCLGILLTNALHALSYACTSSPYSCLYFMPLLMPALHALTHACTSCPYSCLYFMPLLMLVIHALTHACTCACPSWYSLLYFMHVLHATHQCTSCMYFMLLTNVLQAVLRPVLHSCTALHAHACCRWEAQYFIPCLGMLLGNATSGISVGLSTVMDEFASREWVGRRGGGAGAGG